MLACSCLLISTKHKAQVRLSGMSSLYYSTNVNLMVVPKSVGFVQWGTQMSVSNFKSIHIRVVKTFHRPLFHHAVSMAENPTTCDMSSCSFSWASSSITWSSSAGFPSCCGDVNLMISFFCAHEGLLVCHGLKLEIEQWPRCCGWWLHISLAAACKWQRPLLLSLHWPADFLWLTCGRDGTAGPTPLRLSSPYPQIDWSLELHDWGFRTRYYSVVL